MRIQYKPRHLAMSLLGVSIVMASSAHALPVINEVLASHTGADNTEFLELFGEPGESLAGLSLIVIESDAFGPGKIDRRIDFQAGDNIGSNSAYRVGNPIGLAENYDVTPNYVIGSNFIENSSLTVALVETSSLSGNEVTGDELVLDSVALTDGDIGDTFFFDAPVLGPDGSFFPAGAGRVADGLDRDIQADWEFADFNLGPVNTPKGGDTPTPLMAGEYSIMQIQGEGHLSPLLGVNVKTQGIVTAVVFNGFYVQDPYGDDNDATSDALFVFQGAHDAGVEVGDLVEIQDEIAEFIPGGAGAGNLSVTQMAFPVTTVLSSGNPLPAPVVIGRGGRIPPTVDVISASEVDPPINLQDPADAAANTFNPDNDGIDFYESLEGMLVEIRRPVAVSQIRQFGAFSAEAWVLADRGRAVSPKRARTKRGGINLQPDPDNRGDQNPERIQLQFDGPFGSFFGDDYPEIKVGDRLPDIVGLVGYDFGNFEVNVLGPLEGAIKPSRIRQERTRRARKQELTVVSYNVLNLSATEGDDAQRAEIASQIAYNLRGPDIIGLQEIQDNNGDVSDCGGSNEADCAGELSADLTLAKLADAIKAAGGHEYSACTVDPLVETSDANRDDPDSFGGIALGNIRNAFLWNPDRVALVGNCVGLTRDVLKQRGVSVNTAFDTSRDPLEAVFEFRGEKVVIINNHFSSRFGSSPIFGALQPFVQAAVDAREEQALAMNQVTEWWLKKGDDDDANIVVMGDLNTFEFTNDLEKILPAAGGERILFNLVKKNRDDNAYSFNFEGNSQVLDHIFVTEELAEDAKFDFVHVNVDFPRLFTNVVGSDHEPIIARLRFDD